MKYSSSKRLALYAGALSATVAACIWFAIQDRMRATPAGDAIVPSLAPAPRELRRPKVTFDLPVRTFDEPSVTQAAVDIFATTRAPPASPPAEAVAAPLPLLQPVHAVAPTLPYQYRGIATDSEGSWIVQLSNGGQFLLAAKGDVLNAEYRLDEHTEQALTFTHLPSSTVQLLPLQSDSK